MYEIAEYIEIFRDTLGLEQERDILSASCEDTEEWDSYLHMELIAAIEEKFQIRFSGDDVLGFVSFDDGMKILKKNGVFREEE